MALPDGWRPAASPKTVNRPSPKFHFENRIARASVSGSTEGVYPPVGRQRLQLTSHLLPSSLVIPDFSQWFCRGAMDRRKGRSPLTLRFFTRCFVSIPAATNLAPSLLIFDRSRSPFSSMKVTSFRSTTACESPVSWRLCSQHAHSSATHGPANCPHSVQRCSVPVCACVIRNMTASSFAGESAYGEPKV
jgi:hypothetical protein